MPTLWLPVFSSSTAILTSGWWLPPSIAPYTRAPARCGWRKRSKVEVGSGLEDQNPLRQEKSSHRNQDAPPHPLQGGAEAVEILATMSKVILRRLDLPQVYEVAQAESANRSVADRGHAHQTPVFEHPA